MPMTNRQYSPAARREMLATSAKESALIALEILHSELEEPIRVVNDTVPLYMDGHEYQTLPFEIILPDSKEGQVPKAQLSVDNIGRELTQWLEYSRGGQGAKVRIMQVLRTQTDQYAEDYFEPGYGYGESPVIEFDMTMDLSGISVTTPTVAGELGFKDTLNQPAVAVRFDPTTAPGLW